MVVLWQHAQTLAQHYLFVCLQSIAKMGRWINDALSNSYLVFYTPDALLSIGGWSIEKPYDKFWAERFCIPLAQEMVNLVFPFLPGFRKTVEDMGSSAGTSMQSLVSGLDYLGGVVIQDTLDLVDDFPNHPVHAMLLKHPSVRYVAYVYKHYC